MNKIQENVHYTIRDVAADLAYNCKDIELLKREIWEGGQKRTIFTLYYKGLNVKQFKKNWDLLRDKHKEFGALRKRLANNKKSSFFTIKDGRLSLIFSVLKYDKYVRFDQKTISHTMFLSPDTNEKDLLLFIKDRFRKGE